MSNEVNVDTLFFACLDGRVDDLNALCQAGHAHFINEMLMNEQTKIRFSMVYAYLERVVGQPNYDIMQALYDNGADFNTVLIRPEPDGSVFTSPLLHFAIQVWKNPELITWMTAHEADPNAHMTIEKNGVIIKKQSMLCIAIDPPTYEPQVLISLIKGGADVDMICDTHFANGEVPALFIAIVGNENVEQASILIRAGADPNFKVGRKGGFGLLLKMVKLDFPKYLTFADNMGSNYLQLYNQALKIARSSGPL